MVNVCTSSFHCLLFGFALLPVGLSETSHIFCTSWRSTEVREHRVKAYIAGHEAGLKDVHALFEELDHLCSQPEGAALQNDVKVYGDLEKWLRDNRIRPPKTPFTRSYFDHQADAVTNILQASTVLKAHILDYGCGNGAMLSEFHRRGVPRTNLHCIEVYNNGDHGDFQLHVLDDPIEDLRSLAKGKLHQSFDIISSFSVFHHIPDPKTRATALSSIFEMTKPGGRLLLSDWDTEGLPILVEWYDAAHWLLWLLMGSSAPMSARYLDIGTRYQALREYIDAVEATGFQYMAELSTGSKGPVSSFNAVFSRTSSTSWFSGRLAGKENTHGKQLRNLSKSLQHKPRRHSEALPKVLRSWPI